MTKSIIINIITGLVCLLACASCAPNATDFVQASGYDSQGIRTGTFIPSPGTLTPY